MSDATKILLTTSGYIRLTPHYDPDAVTWWFTRQWDDGFAFARGGAVRTYREARHLINHAMPPMAEREHKRYLARITHILGPDGNLTPVDYGYGWRDPSRVTAETR